MTPDAIADVVVATIHRAFAPVLARLDATDHRLATVDRAIDAVAMLRERVAVIEARPPIPGPAGADGTPGRDGADGLGFDDMGLEFDGERTLAFTFKRGDVVKSFPVTLPFLRYQGSYQHDYAYVPGDVVTSGGAAWHCQKPTTFRPGDAVDAWRLMVRKGRDGRDAAAAVVGLR
jgi:hypothetical protein